MTTKRKATTPNRGLKPFNFLTDNQTAKTMFNSNYRNQFTQRQKQRRHLIFRCLIKELRAERFEPDENNEFLDLIVEVPKLNYSRRFDGLDNSDLGSLGVCFVPNFILNALVSEKLAKKFGDLSICECFVRINGYWRLDIDQKLARQGLLMPIKSRISGLIYGLRVFRYPDDENLFILRNREGKWQNHA